MFRLNITIQLPPRVETMRPRGVVVAFLTENNYSSLSSSSISSPTLLPFLASSLHRTRKVERPNSREQADPVSHDSSIMSINRTDTTRHASTSKRLAKIGRHTYCFVRKDLHVICTWLVTKRGFVLITLLIARINPITLI